MKQLGFGLMRFPYLPDGTIDMDTLIKMADWFLERGYTYFDTAYVYANGDSERAVKTVLSDRHPRASFRLATKMPAWPLTCEADLDRLFDEQLERTGAGYFDNYLLHSLNVANLEKFDAVHAWDFLARIKREGRAKRIGFSFHDTPELLDRILTDHPEVEFVQLQINYIDWDNPKIQSRRCYETARSHGKPVIIMEPVKGGCLAGMRPEIRALLTDADPNASVASWALRFAASLDGIEQVLSGMSDLPQMEENTALFDSLTPLTDRERGVLGEVVDRLNATPTVPCTRCRYCTEDCPQQINIPSMIQIYNNYQLYLNKVRETNHYNSLTAKGGLGSECLHCGACEARCPQHIGIIDIVAKCAELFE